MKTQFKSFGKNHTVWGILLAMLLAQTVSAETQFTNEFWISPVVQTNGGANGVYGSGTLDCPYDGSTQTKFDSVMHYLSDDPSPFHHATIHLLAGTYQTLGTPAIYTAGLGWRLQDGQKLLGSGINNTIIRLVTPAPTQSYLIGSYPLYCANIEVADLTLDANYTPANGTVSYGGLGLCGTGGLVARRVRVTNVAGADPNTEVVGIAFSCGGNGSTNNSDGNIIEECEVDVAPGQNCDGLAFYGSPTQLISGVMRNNRIVFSPTTGTLGSAINCAAMRNTLIEGNFVEGATSGFYGDTYGYTNILVAHNVFDNCAYPIMIAGVPRQNLTFCYNTITLSSYGGAAFWFVNNSSYTNIAIIGNTVGYYAPWQPNCGGTFLWVNNIAGLMVANNTVDANLNNSFSGCTGVNMFFNYDLKGNIRTDLDTMGFSTMTSFGRSLMSSASSSAALVNLGLPRNPAVLVTNQQSNVLLFGSLVGSVYGNGYWLTNLSGAAVSGAGAVMKTTVWDTNHLYGLGFGDARFNTVLTWNPNFGPGAWTNQNGACVYWDPSWGGYDAYTNVTYDAPGAYIYYDTYPWITPTNGWEMDAGIAPAGNFSYGTNGYITVGTNYAIQAASFTGAFIGNGAGLTNVHDEAVFTNEFWISTVAQTSGGVNGVYGNGTLACPFDGSTQTKFDSVMHYLSDDPSPFHHSTIHLLAGTYQTLGSSARYSAGLGWRLQDGQKLLGSGIDNTIIRLVTPAPTQSYLIGCYPLYASGIEVSDMTLDANYTPADGAVSYGGMELTGTGNAARRVKVTNVAWAGAQEVYGITFDCGGTGTTNNSEGNIIEECEVYVAAGQNCDGLAFNGGPTQWISGIMRNNRVVFSDTYGMGINGAWMRNTLIEGNYIRGSVSGIYGDTGGYTNVVVAHNVFENCCEGIFLLNAFRQNMTFCYNTFSYTLPNFNAGMFRFFTNSYYTNIVIIGNTVTFNGVQRGSSVTFLDVANITGLLVANNLVDATVPSWPVSNCSGVNMIFNYDLNGNFRTDLDTMGFSAMTSFGRSLMSSANSSAALTNLGLPGNPAVILTNNQSLPVTFNTNVTVNGALNYSNMVAQLLAGTGVTTSLLTTSTGQVVTVNANSQTNGFGNIVTHNVAEFAASTNAVIWNPTIKGPLNDSNLVAQLVAGAGVTTGTAYTPTGQVVTVNANSQTNGFGNIVTHNAPEFATSANATITNATINGALSYSNMVAQLVAGVGVSTGTAYTPTGQVVTVNANSQTNGFGNIVTHGTGEFAASTNALVWNAVTITNSAATNWATFSVTPSNAVIGVRGVNVAILQTNGVLNAYNGLSTTVSNLLPAARVTMNFTNNPYRWTNTTPANMVVYINTIRCSVGYNGSYLAGPVTNGCITVMLKPSSYISVTNYTASGTNVLAWHPF